ncbi:MAG TPA: helix-turn-helix domain-containing protein [Kribbellaceae bacterium]|nr:helix-turn-helix domain-containing protein [Kribbellaceae bacterium]
MGSSGPYRETRYAMHTGSAIGTGETSVVLNSPQQVHIMMPAQATRPYDLDPVAAAEELARVVHAALLAAGKPSLRKLGHKLNYSAGHLSRVFSGRTRPTALLLERLAEALDVEMSTYQNTWQPLWTAAHRKTRTTPAHQAKPTPGVAPAPPEGFECPSCGCWVTNPARHIEWHLGIEGGQEVPPVRLRSAG